MILEFFFIYINMYMSNEIKLYKVQNLIIMYIIIGILIIYFNNLY